MDERKTAAELQGFLASLYCAVLFASAVTLLEGFIAAFTGEQTLMLSVGVFCWMLWGAIALGGTAWNRAFSSKGPSRWVIKDGLALLLWPFILRFIRGRRSPD